MKTRHYVVTASRRSGEWLGNPECIVEIDDAEWPNSDAPSAPADTISVIWPDPLLDESGDLK